MYAISLILTRLCLIYIIIDIGLAYNGSKCEKGQYKNDFLSGGCVKCPERLKDCENEEIDDARRCRSACKREVISTKQPFVSSTAIPQVEILVIADTTSTKNLTKIKNKNSTQGNDRFMPSTSSSVVPNERTDDINNRIIISGVFLILAGLICVVIGLLCWWRTRENTTDVQELRCTYNAVTHEPISNSEQNTSDALSSNAEEVAISVDTELSPLHLSCIEFDSEQNTSDALSSNAEDVAITMDTKSSPLHLSRIEFDKLARGTES